MVRRSTVKNVPKPVLDQLHAMLGDGGWTVDELTAFLENAGHAKSRSAVGRYAKNFEKVAAGIRESREITDALVAELGEASGQGKQGRLLVEMTRSLVFDFLVKARQVEDGDEDSPALDPKSIALLGKGLAELGRALRLDQDFEEKIHKAIAEDHAGKLDEALEEAVANDEPGLSADTVARLRRDFLGVRE